jgi:hypothetical protein
MWTLFFLKIILTVSVAMDGVRNAIYFEHFSTYFENQKLKLTKKFKASASIVVQFY